MSRLSDNIIREERFHPNLQRDVSVGYYVFFPAGGIGRYTRELVTEITPIQGIETELICTPDYHWQSKNNYPVWAGLNSISHEIPTVRKARFLSGQFTNPRKCIARAVDKGMDIIHFSNINHFSFPFWRGAYRKSKLKMAITVHDVKRQKEILYRRWEDHQLKAVYRFADALFVHSQYQADELSAFSGVSHEKIYVVPHGPYPHGTPSDVSTDVLKEKYGITSDSQIALFFGQIRDEKNLEVFLRAVKSSQVDVKVIVAGVGHEKHAGGKYYLNLVKKMGLEENVVLMNRFIEDDEVVELFTLSDWVALPYKNSFTSQSGVLNIAAHYETPVLVSSSPVLYETVRNSHIGVTCDNDTEAALRKGVLEITRKIEQNQIFDFPSYINKYSWKMNAEITLGVYRKLVFG